MTTVLKNGRFFVGPGKHHNESAVFAECMLLDGDEIRHVGKFNDDEIKIALEGGAKQQGMTGRYVLPGFMDGHMHFWLFGNSRRKLQLDFCKTPEEIRSKIKTFAKDNPSLPRILCHGWLQAVTDGVALSSMLDDLDDRPIFIDSKDLHSTWCSTAALKELGILDSTPDPAGGKIHRDKKGKASGLLSEAASQTLVWDFLDRVTPLEEKKAILRDAGKAYNQAGYTGMVEMAMDERQWEVLQALHSEEELSFVGHYRALFLLAVLYR